MKTNNEYQAQLRERRRSTRDCLDIEMLDKGYRRRPVLVYENTHGDFLAFDAKTGEPLIDTQEYLDIEWEN